MKPANESLLVDIVILPVTPRCIVPLTDRVFRGDRDMAVIEAGDEVDSTDNVSGVEKPKCTLLVAGNEVDTIQPLRFPPCMMFLVNFKPTNPQHVHVLQFGQTGMQNPNSIDPENPCI